jgi:glyoxylase-like metal-dependent hydrolase (beta-lactamase superfamily II)
VSRRVQLSEMALSPKTMSQSTIRVQRQPNASAAALIGHPWLSRPDWRDLIAEGLPPEYAEEIPMDLLGLITGLPSEAAQVPWNGPKIRIIEHLAHAPGHAALFIEERGVLVAGDMLSDTLMPFLDLDAANPVEDYLAALRLLQSVADDVEAVIPGHGSVGGAEQLRARIKQDRAYVQELRDGGVPDAGGSVHQPRWIGCPTCINGNYSGSPKESRTRRPNSGRIPDTAASVRLFLDLVAQNYHAVFELGGLDQLLENARSLAA